MFRPVLVGINNPYSGEALAPYPPGCTGWRIWQMLSRVTPGGVAAEDYCRVFRRCNICDQPEFYPSEAVVLLGEQARRWADLPKQFWTERDGVDYYQIPHPSGRCRYYNDEGNRDTVGFLLWFLYSEAQEGRGERRH